jgi:hypothetical protein
MKRRLVFGASLLALCLFGLMPAVAHAGPFEFGTVNIIEDNDFDELLDRDGDATVSDGDWIVGMFESQAVGPLGGQTADSRIKAVFLIELDNVVLAGGGATFDVVPVPFVDAGGLAGFDDNWETFGLERTDDGTLYTIYNDPLNLIDATEGATINDALATATMGTKLFEVGYTGAGGAAAGNEFQSGEVDDATIPPILASAGDLDVLAGLNVTVQFTSLGLTPHQHLVAGFLGPTDVQLVSNFAPGQNPAGSHFDLATDSDIYINPVPLPPAVALCLAMFPGFGGLMAFWRRRGK